MVTPSSPDFHVHDRDTKKFGQLHEDRIFGERGGVVVRVRVAQTPEAGPVVQSSCRLRASPVPPSPRPPAASGGPGSGEEMLRGGEVRDCSIK